MRRGIAIAYAILIVTTYIFVPGIDTAISATCKQPGHIALTFDQGPGPHTIRLLDILSAKNVKATFHVSVDLFRNTTNVEYVKRAHMEGHTIGIFLPESALPSEDSTLASAEPLFTTLYRASNWITTIIGKQPRYVRLGTKRALAVSLRKAIETLGFTITKAKVEIRDENNKMDSIWSSLGRGIAQTVPSNHSFIIKQRDLMPNSVASVDKIIDYVVEKGYLVVPMETCVPPLAKAASAQKHR